MRKEDLGKTRTAPVTQIGNNDFSWKPKKLIRPILEPHIEYSIGNTKPATKFLVPVSKAEMRERQWTEKGIDWVKLGK